MAQFLKLFQVSMILIIIIITPVFSTPPLFKPSDKFSSCEQQSRTATLCYNALLRNLEITLVHLHQGESKEAADAFNKYIKLSLSRRCMPAREDLLQNCNCADPSWGTYCPSSAELMTRFKAMYDEVWHGTSVQQDVRSNFRMLIIAA